MPDETISIPRQLFEGIKQMMQADPHVQVLAAMHQAEQAANQAEPTEQTEEA